MDFDLATLNNKIQKLKDMIMDLKVRENNSMTPTPRWRDSSILYEELGFLEHQKKLLAEFTEFTEQL